MIQRVNIKQSNGGKSDLMKLLLGTTCASHIQLMSSMSHGHVMPVVLQCAAWAVRHLVLACML